MEVKRATQVILIFLTTLFQGCVGTDPKNEDMVDVWVSSAGAMLTIRNDGSFVGEALPAEYFSYPLFGSAKSGKKLSGSGKWKLGKDQGRWVVWLHFEERNGRKEGAVYLVLVGGHSGIAGNYPPWYLYDWVGEEGGERYVYERKKKAKTDLDLPK